MSASETRINLDIEIEQLILGTLFSFPEEIDSVRELLPTLQYFSDPKHRRIYGACLELSDRNESIDASIVAHTLERKGQLENAGRRSYLAELEGLKTSPVRLPTYCKRITEAYKQKKLKNLGTEIIESADSHLEDSSEIMSHIEVALMEMEGEQQRQILRVSSEVKSFVQTILEPNSETSSLRYIKTRLPGLDNLTSGLSRRDMCIIAAPPSMGKTSLALDIALVNLNADLKTLYFSIDQTANDILARLLTSMTGITKAQQRDGNLSERDKEKIKEAENRLSQSNDFFISDDPGLTVTQIRSKARRIKRQFGLDIIIIDYVQQIRPHRRFDTRNLELADISSHLKGLAKELDVVLICLSQLNRDWQPQKISPSKNIWGMPKITMLRDSGVLEQDANTIILLWIPLVVMKSVYGEQSDKYKEVLTKKPEVRNLAFIIVAKNKDGDTGVVECVRDITRMRFHSLPKKKWINTCGPNNDSYEDLLR